MDALTEALFGSKTLAFTLLFLVAMAIPLGIMALASKWSGAATGETFRQNFARFGYAEIPLDLAGHVAHNLFHLLAESKSMYYNTMALFGVHVSGPAALMESGTIQLLQYGTILVGLAGSAYTAYRIARRGTEGSLKAYWPHLLVLILFGIVNIWLFTFPMAHRVKMKHPDWA